MLSAQARGDDLALFFRRHPTVTGIEKRLEARQQSRACGKSRRQHARGGDARIARYGSAPPARDRPRTSKAITASSTCAVQMLEVAFSAADCCSRVCSASRNAGCPAGIDRQADEPGSGQARVLAARAPPYRRHAARHSPSARRKTLRPIQQRYRRRVRREARSVSARRSAADDRQRTLGAE